MNSMHAFVGSDTTGKQWTAFFDAETLHPAVVAYQKQSALIRENHWIPRSAFGKNEFKMIPCKNKKGKPVKPQMIMNNEAPMLFLGYFGILS
jgi:hypothetical protein